MSEMSEMSETSGSLDLLFAFDHVEIVGSRRHTRIVCIYGLSGQIFHTPVALNLTSLYEFGRFAMHVEASAELLPHLVISREVNIGLPDDRHDVGPANALLMVTPRGDAALVFDAEIAGDPDAAEVARLLDVTCLKREELRIDTLPVIDWLRARAEESGLALPSDLSLGPNVHQCVFPGGALLDAIRRGETYWRLIYRVPAPREPGGQPFLLSQPAYLNYPGAIAVGHGRGVSVIAGFSRFAENTYALTAIMPITGLAVLHRSRIKLFEIMRQSSGSVSGSTDAARTEISLLAAQLNDLQLDLEFGVEPYLDGVLIPEALVEAFQQSLCQALDIRLGLEHSSRMLERLEAVIRTRQAMLDSVIQEQVERRDRLFSSLLAVGTLMAVPPALLLAFFALSSDARRTLLDFNAHWSAYALAWLPFIALVAVGWILRRRIQARSTQLHIFEASRSSRTR
jgi:hypothetical protein